MTVQKKVRDREDTNFCTVTKKFITVCNLSKEKNRKRKHQENALILKK